MVFINLLGYEWYRNKNKRSAFSWLLIFCFPWIIGLIIDLSQSFGKSEIASFQISFFVYLLICIFSYLYFVLKNKNLVNE